MNILPKTCFFTKILWQPFLEAKKPLVTENYIAYIEDTTKEVSFTLLYVQKI